MEQDNVVDIGIATFSYEDDEYLVEGVSGDVEDIVMDMLLPEGDYLISLSAEKIDMVISERPFQLLMDGNVVRIVELTLGKKVPMGIWAPSTGLDLEKYLPIDTSLQTEMAIKCNRYFEKHRKSDAILGDATNSAKIVDEEGNTIKLYRELNIISVAVVLPNSLILKYTWEPKNGILSVPGSEAASLFKMKISSLCSKFYAEQLAAVEEEEEEEKKR